MQKKSNFSFLIFTLIIFFGSCNPETETIFTPPVLTTTIVNSITQSTARSGGNITLKGNSIIITRGVCWNTKQNPTINDSMVADTIAINRNSDTFVCEIKGLIASTTYYIRAYASTSEGTEYGNELQFTTQQYQLPILTTTEVTSTTLNSAISGGNITTDGGASILARGVCWNNYSNPTIVNDRTTDGTGTGVFSSAISGLVPSTTYYIRAYATNSVGTVYGNEFMIATDIEGNVYKTVKIGTQIWMVDNLKTTKYNDGTAILLVTDGTTWSSLTSGAYCWYNNDEPTNKSIYGALYNWYAVNTAKLAPTGFHVATDAEWTTLFDYVKANSGISGTTAKALAATTNWASYSFSGTIGNNLSINNSSGFTALPGGFRYDNGSFTTTIGGLGEWWSATEKDPTNASDNFLSIANYDVMRGYDTKSYGLSVRCVKD